MLPKPEASSELPFLPFAWPSLSEETIQEVVDCLRSGWITTGPRVQKFEEALKTYLQAPHVLAVNSGTAGLYLSLKAIDLQEGDEVITTPLTFVATLNTIVLAGGRPVLVDVDPNTYNLCLDRLEKAITPQTKAILPVHFAGLPLDLEALYSLAKHYNLRVIEDSAHAIGSRYKGIPIGGQGDIQVFSFHPNKNMTTGEGGCVSTSDEEVAKKISILRFHGIDRAAWDRFSKKGSQHYDVVAPGHKFNMLDLQAALGLHQVKELDGFIKARRKLAHRYVDLLADIPELVLPPRGAADVDHNWHLFAPLIQEKETSLSRDEVMAALKEQNIGTGLHYMTPHLYSYYQTTYGFRSGDFPLAESIGQRIFSLPLFPDLTLEAQDRVIKALKSLFQTGK